MKKGLLALAAISTLASGTLSARELLCEQCVPEPDCWEHLYVERCQWFVHGEFLYWGVAEGNMDYAVTFDNTGVIVPILTEYKTADFDFCPGFRVAASYYNCPKYWEMTAQYTWMHNDGKNRSSTSDRFALLPTRATFSGDTVDRASSKIEMDYQLGDLYAARVFDPNPHLRLRLFGGITLGYLKQEFDVQYETDDEFLTLQTVDTEWRFFGGGFRMGVIADWFWGCQIYLTGRASFATLYGGYEHKDREFQTDDFGDLVVIVNSKYDDPRFAFHAQFMVGPSWQVPCDCWSFELFAGYEMNLWFNLNEGIYSPNGLIGRTQYYQSVLGLHGLTLRLTLGW